MNDYIKNSETELKIVSTKVEEKLLTLPELTAKRDKAQADLADFETWCETERIARKSIYEQAQNELQVAIDLGIV